MDQLTRLSVPYKGSERPFVALASPALGAALDACIGGLVSLGRYSRSRGEPNGRDGSMAYNSAESPASSFALLAGASLGAIACAVSAWNICRSSRVPSNPFWRGMHRGALLQESADVTPGVP